MDRSREARRSSSMANTNMVHRRRPRSTSHRDSPEEGQVELQETVRIRDRASKKDRDRDRDLLNNRSKRRRRTRREGEEDSTEDSVGEDEEEEEEEQEEEEFGFSDNHRRNFPPARGSRQRKVAEEMIDVPVPRKARSASTKRPQESWLSGNGGAGEEPVRPSPEVGSPSPMNVSVRKKMKAGEGATPRTWPSKVSKSSSEDIEIEIAEVLYGLKNQSQSNKTQEESDGNGVEPRDAKGSGHDSWPLLSSPQLDPSFGVAPKTKEMECENSSGAVEKSSVAAEAEELESKQQPEKKEACSPRAASHGSLESRREDSKRIDEESVRQDAKAISAPCTKPDVDFADLQNSTAGTKAAVAVPEGESKREEKYGIDLMAPPPIAASPYGEGNGITRSISDPKAPVRDEEKVERLVKKDVVLEESEEEKKKEKKKKKRRETTGEKYELPKFDLEKPNQDSDSCVHSTKSQYQQAEASIVKVENTTQSGVAPLPVAVTGWTAGLPSLGYVPHHQTVLPMDGNTASTKPLQPPQFLLPQPRPKRCVTHHYIARNIQLHQQFTKINNFWPAPACNAVQGGAKMSKFSFMPSAEKVINANPFQGGFPNVNLNAVEEEGQAGSTFLSQTGKDKGSEAINSMDTAKRKQLVPQQAPQATPAGSSVHGPAFIFPLNQHPAVTATAAPYQSAPSKPSNTVKNVSLGRNSAGGPLGSNVATGTPGSCSVLPAVTTAVSFNYPNYSPTEAPHMAILQNNVYPFPISTPIGTTAALRGSTPGQTMPFFNGSFFSPQMFHPSQLQQQQPHSQPQVHASHQHTSTSSGSSTSHKQSRGAQVGGNNLLVSASMQVQEPQKQRLPSSKQSRKLEVDLTAEDAPSAADSQGFHAKESVYGQKNFTVPVQPLNFRLMPSAGLAGSSGHQGEKQQHGFKGAVEHFPSPAFAMSFVDFNGNKAPFSGNNMVSTLNFSSLPQNPVIFQSLPDVPQLSYQVIPAAQAVQQKNHQVSEEKSGGVLITSDDAKKTTSGKPSKTTGQTLMFDNSAKTLSFVSSPVSGNWPPRYVTSTTLMTSSPLSGNTSNSQHQQLVQHEVQQHHMLPQQQPAVVTRSKALSPVYSQNLIHCNGSAQSSQSKNTGRTSSSRVNSSFVTSSTSSPRNVPQHQGRAPPGHTQISFGGDSRSAFPPQGPQVVNTTHQSPTTSIPGSPSTAGSLRTNTNGGKAGDTLQSQQTESSSNRGGQKSSPVCGRNLPSILSTCPSHLSELKY